MRKIHTIAILVAGMALGASVALAATTYGALKGSYSFYSGTTTERGDPTPKDTKLLIGITDPVATNIYNRMGKAGQVDDLCGAGLTQRSRGPLACTRDNDSTRCSMVLDLRSGKTSGLPC